MIRKRKSHKVLGRKAFQANGNSQCQSCLPLGFSWKRKKVSMAGTGRYKVGAKDSSDTGESDHVGLEADGFLLKRMKTHQKFAQGSSMLWFLL